VRCRPAAVAAAVAIAALGVGSAATLGAAKRARFDTRVFALIPRPGFPARAYVARNHRVYEGTYDNPSGDTVPSRVLEYSSRRALLHSWTIKGQDLSGAHGVQVATSDSRGRLVLLDKSPARVLTLNPRNGRQRRYATFADLPACKATQAAASCSPNLYVTDYLQAVIWRVPPGGGKAKVWLADQRLDGSEFGTTGLVLAADRRTLLIGQQSEGGLGAGDPTTGRIYSVRIKRGRKPGQLRQLWESQPFDGPDGFAIARSGKIYVTLTVANQIAVVSPKGADLKRFPSAAGSGANGSPVPFDNPSSAWFAGKRLVIANQSYISGNAANQAILDVYAGERGLRELIPHRAGRRAR